jgi:hypothetical protein
MESADGLNARAAGHLKIEHKDLWCVALDRLCGRGQVGRLGHHIHAVLTVKQQPEAPSDQGMVVGQDDRNGQRCPTGVSIARAGASQVQV